MSIAKTLEPKDPETQILRDLQTQRIRDPETQKQRPRNPEIQRPRNPETWKPRKPQEPKGPRTKNHSDLSAFNGCVISVVDILRKTQKEASSRAKMSQKSNKGNNSALMIRKSFLALGQ